MDLRRYTNFANENCFWRQNNEENVSFGIFLKQGYYLE